MYTNSIRKPQKQNVDLFSVLVVCVDVIVQAVLRLVLLVADTKIFRYKIEYYENQRKYP